MYKFRVLKIDREWLYFDLYQDIQRHVLDKGLRLETTGMSLGFQDANGKDVYDGDVIKNNEDTFTVSFEQGEVKKDGKGFHLIEAEYGTIVGNIHE